MNKTFGIKEKVSNNSNSYGELQGTEKNSKRESAGETRTKL